MNRKTTALGLAAFLLTLGSGGVAFAATGSDSSTPSVSPSSSASSSSSTVEDNPARIGNDDNGVDAGPSASASPSASSSTEGVHHHRRHRGGRGGVEDNSLTSGRHGAHHLSGVEAGDDNGGRGELEPGDDHGRGIEAGDDNGRGIEAGDDNGGRHGGHGSDD